ncbi:hypothetical protein KBD81_00190 [Candidatus Woesebacteria bacterium]|nr:hypothetical protein [Candidatus Woesebacteria bacterium]
MKNIKVILISVILALVVYGAYQYLKNSSPSLSPIPENGIKVIQISPTTP